MSLEERRQIVHVRKMALDDVAFAFPSREEQAEYNRRKALYEEAKADLAKAEAGLI